ncbi:MAG: uracil-DNA glycosylase [Acidimicrobiales bacterium]
MDASEALLDLNGRIVSCRRCPRLVEWREQVAHEKRASFRDEEYWGRPCVGFGDPDASLLIIGLAPAAHGANRTGRMFTGDRSVDFLYASLYRTGWANQPRSDARDDGLELRGAFITAAVRCAPPANKPTVQERDTCKTFLDEELEILSKVKIFVALGGFGYAVAAGLLGIRPRPKFGHGVEVPLADGRTVICSFHPSQQNTFTGRLTEPMLDAVFNRARELSV